MTQAQFADQIRKALVVSAARDPHEVFCDAVKSGSIDRDGRLPRLFGGTAESDPFVRTADDKSEVGQMLA